MARKYILSLDGSGIHAIVAAVALARLERTTGRLTRDIFSLVDGASTCGAVAALIAAGVPAAQIVELLVNELPPVFNDGGIFRQMTKGHKYSIRRFHQALQGRLGSAANWTLNDSPIDLFFLARRTTDGKPFYLVKDKPGNSGCSGTLRLLDCATAVAALPLYFEAWKLPQPDAPRSSGCETPGELVDASLGAGANTYWTCVEAFYFTGEYHPPETTVVALGIHRGPSTGETPRSFLSWVTWMVARALPSFLDQRSEMLTRQFPDVKLYRVAEPMQDESRTLLIDNSDDIPEVRRRAELLADRLNWAAMLEGAATPDLVESARQSVSVQVTVPEAETPYHKAAAVLAFYNPETLRPFEPGYLERLVSDSAMITDRKGQLHWTLSNEVRQRVLRSLGGPEHMKEALSANPARTGDALQSMLDRYINGDPPAVDKQDIEQLTSTLQVIEWMGDVLPGLPDETEVRNRIERLRLLDTFRQLADKHFRGRKNELRELREYVGALEPATVIDQVTRRYRAIVSQVRPPVFIHGPGGVGKSTLLARFILEHAGSPTPVPFLYFDFDRSDLLPEEPSTLLIEALRQLALQYPRSRRDCETLRNRWSQRLADEVERRGAPANGGGLLPHFIAEFLDLLSRIPALANQPLVLILDTFEDVQTRRPEAVRQIWRLIVDLQQGYPKLRCILAGRALLKGYAVESKPLGQLDPESAEAVLESYGVANPEVARRVVKQVGGDPLSLRLAAEVIGREQPGKDGIAGLEINRFTLFRMSEEMIQGQLYRRILGYIEDRDVRRLAHPGLTLRRITPDLIRWVLAGPCEVDVPDNQRARELFGKLQREVALVVPADELLPSDPDALRHRPDIRRIMLRLIREDQPEKVRQIGQNAIRYYAEQYDRGRDPVLARAEEIYHRLSLGEAPEEVGMRWVPGVENYLRNALEDLPPRSQAFLASRLGISVEQEIAGQADQETWEREATRRVEALLRTGDQDGARRVLAERSDRRPASPLYRLEASVWVRSGDWSRALRIVNDGLASGTEATGNEPLRLAVMRAEIELKTRRSSPSAEVIDEYETLIHRYPGEYELLLQLGLYRRSSSDSIHQGSLDKLTVSIVDQLPEAALDGHPEILLRTAAALRDSYPERMNALIRRTGLGPRFIRDNLSKLSDFLSLWDTALSGALAREADLPAGSSLKDRWSRYLVLTSFEAAARTVDTLLRRNDLPSDAFQSLTNLIGDVSP